jgi:hypothetical protein
MRRANLGISYSGIGFGPEYFGRADGIPTSGWEEITVKIKTILGWAVVIFIVYYLATQPVGAAHSVHSIFDGLRSAGNSLATFVNSL